MSRFSLLAACLLLCPSLSAREWTATDGRKLQAEFVSATDTTVTLKLANGQAGTLPQARLSEADQVWVYEQPDPSAEATSHSVPTSRLRPLPGSHGLASLPGVFARSSLDPWLMALMPLASQTVGK